MNSQKHFINPIFRIILIISIVLTFLGVMPSQPVRAAQHTVTSDADSGIGSLRAIVAAAGAGDIITFSSSLDGATIHLLSEIVIDKELQISGYQRDPVVTLDGGDSNRIFNIASTGELSISWLILEDGNETNGGAVYNEGLFYSHKNTFSSNTATNGGAIYNTGYIYIADSTLSDNSATNGGAIYQNSTTGSFGRSRINRSTLTGNSASSNGGAVIVNTGMQFEFENTTLYNNAATGSGGGLYNAGLTYLEMSTLSDNSAASSSGGGINNASGSTLHMFNTIIANSSAGGDCVNGGTISTNDNNLIEDNTCSPAENGDPGLLPLTNNGGYTETMALGSGSPAIDAGRDLSCVEDQREVDRPQGDHCDIGAFETVGTLQVNSLSDPGDGNCNTTACTLREAIAAAASGDTITFHSDLSGGMITVGSTLEISKDLNLDGTSLDSNIILSGDGSVQIMAIDESTVNINHINFQDGYHQTGGAIINSGMLVVDYSDFLWNSALWYGGAIYNTGDISINNSNFESNIAEIDGGAIYEDSSDLSSVYSTTFSNNGATHAGGAIYNNSGSQLKVVVSTFYSNGAALDGGGIFNDGSLLLQNSTFSGNSVGSGTGGGIHNHTSGFMMFSNTIIANSTTGGDCVNSGLISSNINNLIEDNSCSPDLSGDPNLGSLEYNGGYTKTMALLPGSSAIDSGDDAECNSRDQRDVYVPQGAHCDIGAYEAASLLEVNHAGDTGDGYCNSSECTLREAIAVAAKDDTITFSEISGSTINLGSSLVLDKNLTLDGSALASPVIISGQDTYQVFDLSPNVDVSLTALEISNGNASVGGVLNIPASSEVVVNKCTFDSNQAGTGGVINNEGTLNVSNSTFNNNSATNYGGVLNNYGGMMTIASCYFSENSALQNGGAVHNYDGTMTVRSSTFYENSSDQYGGALHNTAALTIADSTISDNEALLGGAGIFSGSGVSILNLSGSIIANSRTKEDCLLGGGTFNTSFDLIEDGTCSPSQSGDPGLTSPADNGGFTWTMAITEGSPAFDSGGDSCESTDQRGIPRPQGAHCDIGAYEIAFPEIDIQGNSQSIAAGDSTPSSTDHTDFGTGFLGLSPLTRTFTILNTGAEQLNLTSSPDYVQVAGTHASDFTVTSQPSTPVAASGGTATFIISFSPSAIGLREATISIGNNDPDENPYTFSIQGAGSDGTFSDVTSAHWAFQYVEAIADAGLTSGYPDGTYRPENPVTRAEMAVFLLNGMGVTAPPINGSHPFTDIAGHWAESYIEELFDQGITGGYPDGTYRPENLVTRAEMAVFLLKGIGVTPPAMDGSHPFTDVAGHWAEIFIEELFDQGITGGYPDGTYRPENQVTRAEMAVFLVNAFNIPLP